MSDLRRILLLTILLAVAGVVSLANTPTPLYGSYSAVDLITFTDYRRASVPDLTNDEREIMRMIHQLGLTETMQKVASDPGYQKDDGACHGAAHVVGYAAFDLMGTKALEECTTLCFSGCYHGALQRMSVRTGTGPGELARTLTELCSARTTLFERDQCFHGAGHGFLLQAKYEIDPALLECRSFERPEDIYSCYRGVFMENYVGDGNDTRFSRTDLHAPCNRYADDTAAQTACYRMQATHFLTVYEDDFTKASAECLRAPVSMQATCFKRLGQLASVTDDPSGSTETFCRSVPEKYGNECILGGLGEVIDFNGIDPEGSPAHFCRGLKESEAKDVCYEEYARQLKDLFPDKEERLTLCALFEAPYQESCRHMQ